MDRRAFLAGVGTAGVAGLAGCSSPSTEGSTDGSGGRTDVPAPGVDARALESGGWERTDELAEQVLDTSVSVVEVEGYSHTLVYGNRALRDRLRRETLGAFDAPVMQFFASRIELDPAVDDLPFGIGLDRILTRMHERAEGTFVGRLRDQGLSNPRTVDRATPDLDRGRTTTYAAEFDYGAMEIPIAGGEAMTVPGGSLAVRGLVSVWKGEGSLFVAGGACPGENFAESLTREVTGAVTVDVDVDLRLAPDEYWRELQRLVMGVS